MDPNVAIQDAMPLAEYTVASLFPHKIAALLLSCWALWRWCWPRSACIA